MKMKIFVSFIFIIFLGILEVVSAASDIQKTLGDPNSLITIEVFTDFQDSFSAKWWIETLPSIQENYISNGKVNILFKHLTLAFHQNSVIRAKAVECAAEQNQFFNFAETFYNNLDKEYSFEDIQNIVDLHSLDSTSFKKCFYAGITEEKISLETKEGIDRGVKGIPTFFIGDDSMGAQEYKLFAESIEKALKNAPNREQKIENVTCIFSNSDTSEKCFTDNSRYLCDSGQMFNSEKINSCNLDVSGVVFLNDNNIIIKAETLIWGSSCGSFQKTKTDGKDETLYFDCSEKNPNKDQKGFRYAYWRCYNGKEQNSQDDSSCKLSRTWKKYAEEFCEGYGVNSFGVSVECYYDNEEVITEKPIIYEENEKDDEIEDSEKIDDISFCKNSCFFEEKCYPFGFRKAGEFCSDKGIFTPQLLAENSCENNFECESNLCIDNACVSGNLWAKFLQWLKKIFG